MSVGAFTDPREGRRALLSLLADGEHPIELRCRTPRGKWLKAFCSTPEEADKRAHGLTATHDVFVGLLPRLGRTGEDQCRYAPSRVLWVDCDSYRAVRKLELFEPTPTARVRSGGIDGETPKRHGYWLLSECLEPEELTRHELRLAHHLEADLTVCDAGRVARLPGSRSHKTGRVARVEAFTGELHSLEALTGELEDAPSWAAPSAPQRAKSTDELVRLFAGTYSDGQGRHEHFRSVVGVLLARCPRMPPDALYELARCWAKQHTRPCKDDHELERNFDNLLARELNRRGLT